MRCKTTSTFILLFVLLFLMSCAKASNIISPPLIWDVQSFYETKFDSTQSSSRQKLFSKADDYCGASPVVITTKEKTFAPNPHYYCSVGIYWWPDSVQSGKYIWKDGVVNPESRTYDLDRLKDMVKRCQDLCMAFFYSEDVRYYNAFIRQLRAWFIDRDTYMYPNLEYAQVIPGQRNNLGRDNGMIDAYNFNNVIESIRLVNSIKKIDDVTSAALQEWFNDLADWAYTGRAERALRKANNNIGTAYDVTLINMYLFAGNQKRAKEIADHFAERRIYVQIEEDGKQPAELARTKAYGYSISNLTRIIDFCYLVKYWDKDYYIKHRERIDKAFSYLLKYSNNEGAFPYQQITSWEDCQKRLAKQIERRDKLKSGERNKGKDILD